MTTKIFCNIAELDLIKKFNKKKIVKAFLIDSKKSKFKIQQDYFKLMIKKKYCVFVLALYLSLLLGLFFGEDFLGGAAIDYTKILTNKLSIFKEDLLYYFINYEELNFRHSPIFQIIHIFFLNTFNHDIIFRVINIHINLLIIVKF